jgi:hypothetical protein
MRTAGGLLLIATVGLLALAGCGKSESSKPAAVPPGAIDLGSLQRAFPAPTPEVLTSLDKIRRGARYRQFAPVLAELNKLAQLPDLTEPQKKALSNVIEQVKVAINTGPPPPSR